MQEEGEHDEGVPGHYEYRVRCQIGFDPIACSMTFNGQTHHDISNEQDNFPYNFMNQYQRVCGPRLLQYVPETEQENTQQEL